VVKALLYGSRRHVEATLRRRVREDGSQGRTCFKENIFTDKVMLFDMRKADMNLKDEPPFPLYSGFRGTEICTGYTVPTSE
jgi:hypothetical protein